VPVHHESEMCLFEQLLGDIGDAQSIENELSTYSSKLQKMEYFLRHADEESLLLIDEFGSGSDPELGSALAQVFLEKLNGFKSFGILTTHFNSIKALAAETEGIVNGAMLFERETFSPRYELIIGQPGSSYTFEVAQQSGIAKHIIEAARGRIKQNTLEIDRLLVQIQEDKVSIDRTRKEQERELQKLRVLEAEQQGKIAKLEEKLTKQSRLNEEGDRMMYWGLRFQKLIDSWMDQKTQKDKKEVIARFIAMLNLRSGEVQKEEIKSHQQKITTRHVNIDKYIKEVIAIGAQVKIIDSGIVGTLMEHKGSKYIVALGGNLTASLDREKFVHADAPIGNQPKAKKRNKNFKNQEPKEGSADQKKKQTPEAQNKNVSQKSSPKKPKPSKEQGISKGQKEGSPSVNNHQAKRKNKAQNNPQQKPSDAAPIKSKEIKKQEP
jgi:DNA mismatch repair protein MutS2